MEEIDHEYTDEVVCPYCAYIHQDSWETPNFGEMDCENCHKKFEHERDVSISYITRKIDKI